MSTKPLKLGVSSNPPCFVLVYQKDAKKRKYQAEIEEQDLIQVPCSFSLFVTVSLSFSFSLSRTSNPWFYSSKQESITTQASIWM